MIQMVEERINQALFVVSVGETVTMEQLERMDAFQRTGSLRKALDRLSRRVDFPHDLQSFLEEFIRKRNYLAHRFNSIPGVGVGTEAGRREASKFLFYLT